MEPNHLTVSQTNWNKHSLFGKLVLWNRPRGVRSQKKQVNLWFAVCLNQRNKSYHIFSIASYCIELHCVELNRIALHRNRVESYRIASVAASYVSSMYRIVGYASRCVSHRPQLWRCTSLLYIVDYTYTNWDCSKTLHKYCSCNCAKEIFVHEIVQKIYTLYIKLLCRKEILWEAAHSAKWFCSAMHK